MDIKDLVSDEDAFLISVRGWVYYYAIQADLDGKGRHWYKENKKTREIVEVEEKEIVDFVVNKPEKIFEKCPCVVLMDDEHLEPLIE